MNTLKSLLIITLVSLSVTNATAQKTKHQHTDHLSSLLTHYMAVKEALTEDDLKTAQTHMEKLRSEVLENKEMSHHKEHSKMHAKHHGAMVDAVEKGNDANDIKVLRLAFVDITTHLKMALENQGYNEGTLYLQYCPMANDGEGASWISNQKAIANPYMGKKMPTCGVTKQTINSGSE